MTPDDATRPPSVQEIEARMLDTIAQTTGAQTTGAQTTGARTTGGAPSRRPPQPVVHLAELLPLDGEAFVTATYRSVLGRDPDPDGLRQHVQMLRSGLDKADMVQSLRDSTEGTEAGVTLVGQPGTRGALRRFYGLPLVGRALHAATALPRVRRLMHDVLGLHGSILALQRDAQVDRHRLGELQDASRMQGKALANRVDGLSRRIASAEAGLGARLDALAAEQAREPWADALLLLADRQDELTRRQRDVDAGGLLPTSVEAVTALAQAFEEIRRDQGWTETGAALVARAAELFSLQDDRIRRAEALAEASRREMEDQRRRITLLLEAVRHRLDQPLGAEDSAKLDAQGDHLLDELYLQFEDRFRGSRDLIKDRQRVHLPRMTASGAGTPDRPILDVGAGRGEWLELLRESGLTARGIDLNESMVEACRTRGLDCAQDDAVAGLAKLPAGSLGAVTGFHVIEHLPFRTLVALLDEALRALASGGVILFETPNPANLLVGSRWFYLDPTHRNPLPGELVAMVAEARGFVDVAIEPLHPAQGGFSGQDRLLARQLDGLFYGPQDYALVARKA